MSYKVNVTTPIQTYSVVFGKRNNDYFVEVNGKDNKVVFGNKERVNTYFKKFLTSIGNKEEYQDYATRFEKLNLKNFSSSKVFVDA